jgi:hypothetical protein
VISRLLPSPSLLRGLVVLGVLVVGSSEIGAQVVTRFGHGSASLAMPVTLQIPVRLMVSPAGSERVIQRTATYSEVDLPVRVAANLGWSLTVALGAATDVGPVLIRTADGGWVDLGSTDARTVERSSEPANALEVRIRLRLPAGMESTSALRLRLSLVPAEGAGS